MKEKLLQFIWQQQYFNRSDLQSSNGEELQVINPGTLNFNQGPDFINATIKIGNTTWVGNIEIHLRSGIWYLHNHDNDTNFNNIILHVVWKHDLEVKDGNGTLLPTLELHQRVPKFLLSKYETLMSSSEFIPCGKTISKINALTLESWKQRLVIERLQKRTGRILTLLNQNNNHWDETFWWLLATNFGMKVNGIAFESISRSLPQKILAKHRNQLIQVEALLLGQAGLLNEDFNSKYAILLQKEYQFLSAKYSLKQIDTPILFLRMRPSNFPTLRLAQLAALIANTEHLFSKILSFNTVLEVRNVFKIMPNDHWNYHYTLDNPSEYKVKYLGNQMIENIIINTVIPLIFAYGKFHNEHSLMDKALSWMENCSAEKNVITNGFANLDLPHKNAFDSQAFIQLKNEYCKHKRCLNCAVGNSLLKMQDPLN